MYLYIINTFFLSNGIVCISLNFTWHEVSRNDRKLFNQEKGNEEDAYLTFCVTLSTYTIDILIGQVKDRLWSDKCRT